MKSHTLASELLINGETLTLDHIRAVSRCVEVVGLMSV